MSRGYDEQMQALERRLDKEYKALFPQGAGWEPAALHLLLVQDADLRSQMDLSLLDDTKYQLMHALRWGGSCGGKPYLAIPSCHDSEIFERCDCVYRRASDYVGVWFAFISYWKGICEIRKLTDASLEMEPNVDWMAFQALDSRIHDEKSDSRNEADLWVKIGNLAHETAQTYCEDVRGVGTYSPNFKDLAELMTQMRARFTHAYELPDEWSLKGIRIGTLRTFWDSVALLGFHHLAVMKLLYPGPEPRVGGLMIWPVGKWVAWISACTGLMEGSIQEILKLHMYDRESKTPDIALAPFIEIGTNILVSSPFLVCWSFPERNFCAHAARNYMDDYAQASHILETAMSRDLAREFQKGGFRVRTKVKIKGTDIDILVWAPEERRVFAAELKWIIQPTDFMEVINRGEKTVMDVMTNKLPKYSAALENGAGRLVKRAFRLKEEPEIDDWSSGLVMRGFSGTSRIPHEEYGFVRWELAIRKIRSVHTLEEFAQWLQKMPFIPQAGRDFNVMYQEIFSPSGFRLLVPHIVAYVSTTI